MNSAHDMGGLMGFGPVAPNPDEPRFHAEWERRAFALTIAAGATGAWSIDAMRHARESLPPPEYLTSTYYEIWAKALERMVLARGLASRDELAAERALAPRAAVGPALRGEDVPARMARGFPYDRPAPAPARFAPGERVRARNIHPSGHTRLPRYVRGRVGTVEHVDGHHVFADASAAGDEAAQWLYTVRFEGAELWGEAAEPGLSVSVDAWESYLEPA